MSDPSDGELESVHDFIQWIFPLREPSRFNPDPPLLTDADIAEFRADSASKANLLRSLDLFLGLRRSVGRVVVSTRPNLPRSTRMSRDASRNRFAG